MKKILFASFLLASTFAMAQMKTPGLLMATGPTYKKLSSDQIQDELNKSPRLRHQMECLRGIAHKNETKQLITKLSKILDNSNIYFLDSDAKKYGSSTERRISLINTVSPVNPYDIRVGGFQLLTNLMTYSLNSKATYTSDSCAKKEKIFLKRITELVQRMSSAKDVSKDFTFSPSEKPDIYTPQPHDS